MFLGFFFSLWGFVSFDLYSKLESGKYKLTLPHVALTLK